MKGSPRKDCKDSPHRRLTDQRPASMKGSPRKDCKDRPASSPTPRCSGLNEGQPPEGLQLYGERTMRVGFALPQ